MNDGRRRSGRTDAERIDRSSGHLSDRIPAQERANPGPQPTDREPVPVGTRRVLVLAAAAGLIAGVASWLAGEMVQRRYQRDLLAPLSISPSPDQMRRWKDARLHGAALTFTLMGGCLGLAMGAAGGAAHRSGSAGVRAAIVGLVLGTAGAAARQLSSCRFSSEGTTRTPATWYFPCSPMASSNRPWRRRRPGIRPGPRRSGSLEIRSGGRTCRRGRGDDRLRDRRGSRLCDLPDGYASVIVDRHRGMAQLLVAFLSAVGASLALHQSAKTVH